MRIDRIKLAGTFLLAGLAAAPFAAAASIPPSIAPIIVSNDKQTEAINGAYLEWLSRNENFLIADGPIMRWQAADCLRRRGEPVGCIHRLLREKPANKQAPPVVLLIRRGEGDNYHWICVGYGRQPETVTPRASIDLKSAMFGDAAARAEMRDKALRCLFSAASEAEGVIRR